MEGDESSCPVDVQLDDAAERPSPVLGALRVVSSVEEASLLGVEKKGALPSLARSSEEEGLLAAFESPDDPA